MADFPETNHSLIARVQDLGDGASWAEFLAIYQPVVYRIARRRQVQEADALDVVQQVLLSIAKSIERRELGEGQPLEPVLKLLGPTNDPHKLGRIGTYEVIGVIGRGGMGVVFKAFDAALNRFVAIKMLLPHLAVSGAARKRFAREGQAAAAVTDSNVLPIYGVAEWQGVPYLVTQYSRGTTLKSGFWIKGRWS